MAPHLFRCLLTGPLTAASSSGGGGGGVVFDHRMLLCLSATMAYCFSVN